MSNNRKLCRLLTKWYILFKFQMQYSMINIDSQGLNDFLHEWTQSFMPDQHAWIGGKSVRTWGDWSWADGSPWSYTNWDDSQPKRDDMGMGDENCVTINSWKGAGKWWDVLCNNYYGFFCSMTPQTTSGSATATISVDDCPDNGWPYSWRVYGNMCYTFGDIGMTWDNARTQCETTAKSISIGMEVT